MLSANRRFERREDILVRISKDFGFGSRLHFEKYEADDLFLEGTGSMILDRPNRIVYACRSPRTDEKVLQDFCRHRGYEPVLFDAVDGRGQAIYHTNVMLAVGESFAVICLSSLADPEEQAMVVEQFGRTNKEIVDISLDQMMSFAGNMLQVSNATGQALLVMSEQAFKSLAEEQVEQIEGHCRILYSPLDVIEAYGGGSARCMMAEVFRPT